MRTDTLTCPAGFGYHGKCPVVTPFDIKSRFQGPIIGNIGYTRDTADGAIRSGAVDLVSIKAAL